MEPLSSRLGDLGGTELAGSPAPAAAAAPALAAWLLPGTIPAWAWPSPPNPQRTEPQAGILPDHAQQTSNLSVLLQSTEPPRQAAWEKQPVLVSELPCSWLDLGLPSKIFRVWERPRDRRVHTAPHPDTARAGDPPTCSQRLTLPVQATSGVSPSVENPRVRGVCHVGDPISSAWLESHEADSETRILLRVVYLGSDSRKLQEIEEGRRKGRKLIKGPMTWTNVLQMSVG